MNTTVRGVAIASMLCAAILCAGCKFTTAHFSEVSMSRAVDAEGRPTQKTSEFNKHDGVLYCCAQMANTPSGTKAKAVWRYKAPSGVQMLDSAEITVDEDRWIMFSLKVSNDGLPYGAYEVELFVDGISKKVQPFTVVPMYTSGLLKEAVISSGINDSYFPEGTGNVFQPGVPVIYAPVYVEDAPAGTVVTAVWRQKLPDGSEPVIVSADFKPTGSGWIGFSFRPSQPLPAGGYSVAIMVNGTSAAVLPFTVQ